MNTRPPVEVIRNRMLKPALTPQPQVLKPATIVNYTEEDGSVGGSDLIVAGVQSDKDDGQHQQTH